MAFRVQTWSYKRSGRPKTATPEIEQVHNLVNEDPGLTKHEIGDDISILDEQIHKFHMKELLVETCVCLILLNFQLPQF